MEENIIDQQEIVSEQVIETTDDGAVVTKENGERILSVSQTETGDMLRIYLRDGFADVSVIRKGSLEET